MRELRSEGGKELGDKEICRECRRLVNWWDVFKGGVEKVWVEARRDVWEFRAGEGEGGTAGG